MSGFFTAHAVAGFKCLFSLAGAQHAFLRRFGAAQGVMMKAKRLAALWGAVFAAFAVAGNVNAGLLGETLGAEWLLPDTNTVYCCTASAVVGAGVEFPAGSFSLVTPSTFVDASDTQVVYGSSFNGTFGNLSFNGLHLFDALSLIDEITGVSIVGGGATTLPGFDASRVSFDADNIYLNVAGLGADGQVVLALRFADSAAVPEPATMALLGIGLAGLGFGRRKLAAKGRTARGRLRQGG